MSIEKALALGALGKANENAVELDNVAIKLDNIQVPTTIAAVANVYALPLASANTKRFSIETTDAVAKSITLNSPATVCEVVVKLKYTNNATITFPAGVVWKDGVAPSFNQNKLYFLYFFTDDGGTSWLGSWTGAW